jgi:Mg2+/Co2+ transporter CorB
LIPVLIGFSGFFSASETVITGASRAQLHNEEKKHDTRATAVRILQEKFGPTLSSILIANQLINQSVAAVATWLAIELWGESVLPVTAFLFSLLVIIYAEILPKLVVIQNPTQYALTFAHVLTVICKLLRPVTHFLEATARFSLRLIGLKIRFVESSPISDDELRGAIDLHAAGGIEEERERLMLRSILDLHEVTVGQIMVHRKKLEMIEVSQNAEDMIIKILDCPYSRIPLWKENRENILGVLHVKTLFRALQEVKAEASTVDPISLAAPPWFVPESTTLSDQLQAFRMRHEHFALVVDEYGTLMGAITLEDILEEIVGEIVDEYDVAATGISVQSDQSIIVEGAVLIRDLNRRFDWDLPEEEVSTIAGLVMHKVRKIPAVGQKCIFPEFTIEVLKHQHNRISLLRISLQESQKDTHEY